MSLEYRSFPEEKAKSPLTANHHPVRLTRLRLAVLSAVIAATGCSTVFENEGTSSPVTYSVDTLPVSDPSLITIDEIAAITSDRLAPERLQELMDSLEIADGNIRFHRVLMARESVRPVNGSHILADLQSKKLELESDAQQVVSLLCRETSLDIPYERLSYPDAFRLQSLFDAEEEYQDDPGRLNTFILHQMKHEETKLRHLRLMISLCRTSRHLTEEEKRIQLRQLSMAVNITEDGIQLLQNTFHKKLQR